MLFVSNRGDVNEGEQIRFMLTNEGMVNHPFVLGTRKEINEHAKEVKTPPHGPSRFPFRTLRIDVRDEFLWRFTKAGQFVFGCLIPGHLERGMIGIVIVVASNDGSDVIDAFTRRRVRSVVRRVARRRIRGVSPF